VRLAQKSKVMAVEIDNNLCDFVRRVKNTVAMNNDVVKILQEARRDKRMGTFNKVAGNIPYSRSQDILIELLSHPWKVAVLCVQKEFAGKLFDKNEKISHAVADCVKAEIKLQIPAEKFYPKAVPSSIIILKQKKLLDDSYWQFLQKLFKAKNKNISNIFPKAPAKFKVKKATQLTEKEIKELFASQGKK